VKAADPELHEKVKTGEVSGEDARRLASRNVDHNEEATSNVTPFSEERSRPISVNDKCVRQFKNLVKDLGQEFNTTPALVRAYIRDYLEDHR
jgi:hypothetical protein